MMGHAAMYTFVQQHTSAPRAGQKMPMGAPLLRSSASVMVAMYACRHAHIMAWKELQELLMSSFAYLLHWCQPVHACNQLVARASTTIPQAKFACKCLRRHNTCLL